MITRRERNQLNRSSPLISLDNWKSKKDENANQESSANTGNDVKHGTSAHSSSIILNNNNSFHKPKNCHSSDAIIPEECQTTTNISSVGQRQEHKTPIKKEICDFVGFSNICGQRQRIKRQRGSSLRLMVLGEKGVGKSTLINSLLWGGTEHSVQQYSQYRELSATLKEGIRVSALEFPGEEINRSH